MRLRTEGVTWQELEGELVILDVVRSVYLTTNASGALLTKLLRDDRSSDDLVAALVAEYRLERTHAEADVEGFLQELRGKDLLA